MGGLARPRRRSTSSPGWRASRSSFTPGPRLDARLVLMAKNAYVWLDQLSRSTGGRSPTLDQVPDEELDRLARCGFTGLWLIGLWERSPASQRIKQLSGNPDAVASAYSLLDYQIAADLGGEAAVENLRSAPGSAASAWPAIWCPTMWASTRRWVMEHPDWFISLRLQPLPLVQLQRAGPLLERPRRHLPGGPLLRPHRRGGGLQAGRPPDRRRRATSTTATTAPACPGTTPPSSTT